MHEWSFVAFTTRTNDLGWFWYDLLEFGMIEDEKFSKMFKFTYSNTGSIPVANGADFSFNKDPRNQKRSWEKLSKRAVN